MIFKFNFFYRYNDEYKKLKLIFFIEHNGNIYINYIKNAKRTY